MSHCQLSTSNEKSTNAKSSTSEYVCVEYPGVGKKVDKMIQCLGGLKNISEVYCEENRRMELRYRPTDLFCKPLCGERHSSTALLIKVTCRKKKQREPRAAQNEDSETYQVEPLGVVLNTFKFDNLCDFQYLPMCATEDGTKLECMAEDLLPQGIISSDWLDQPAPFFLPPATFSRMDTPQDYRYKTETNNEGKVKTPQNVICGTRQKRTHFAIFRSFKDEGVPQKPLSGAVSQVRFKLMGSEYFLKLKNEFSKRPIWSKNALRVRLRFSKDKLKYLLPIISYYFHTGPWRNLWVKLGYDPRSDPTSWIYQTFDFRIRQAGGMKTKVEAKRNYSNYILPYKSVHSNKKKTSLVSSLHLNEDSAEGGEEKKEAETSKVADGLLEEFYLFRPGMIPPYRQMFYQYCDIHVPEIQKLLEASILSDANETCSEKYGWLPAGVETKCRDILSSLIERTLAERCAKGGNLKEEELMSNSEAEDSTLEGNSTDEETQELLP